MSTCGIERGEFFALLGPNGAGKTTTVEILEGYRHRDGGEVSVLGRDPAHGDGRPGGRRLGIVLQTHRRPGRAHGRGVGTPLRRATTRPRATPTRSSRRSGLAEKRTARAAARSPAGSAAGSTSRSASSAAPSCCSSTSRPPASTPRRGATFWELIDGLKAERHHDPAHHALPGGGRAPRRPGRRDRRRRGARRATPRTRSAAGSDRQRAWCAGARTARTAGRGHRRAHRGRAASSPPGSAARCPSSPCCGRASRTSTST